MRRTIVGLCAALAVTCGMAGVTATSASAVGNHDTFVWYKNLNYYGNFAGQHTIDEVYSFADGQPTCVAAWQPSPAPGAWAGTSVCATGYSSHVYCACALRQGWAGGGLGPTWVFHFESVQNY